MTRRWTRFSIWEVGMVLVGDREHDRSLGGNGALTELDDLFCLVILSLLRPFRMVCGPLILEDGIEVSGL